MSRVHSLSLLLALSLLPVGVGAVAPDQLEGRWCLTGVAAVDGSRSRPIGREWTFARGGLLRVQSEASENVRMSVRYRLEEDRLSVPDLDLRLDIERHDGSRMTALGREGKLRYRFRRGRCRDSDRDAASESRREAGRDAGNGGSDTGRGDPGPDDPARDRP